MSGDDINTKTDIHPAVARRKAEMVQLLEEILQRVESGDVDNLFLAVGYERGCQTFAIWHSRIELLGVIAVAENDVLHPPVRK